MKKFLIKRIWKKLFFVPNEIYPDLKRIFLNLLTESGYPGIKFEKKIDFTELYNQRSN